MTLHPAELDPRLAHLPLVLWVEPPAVVAVMDTLPRDHPCLYSGTVLFPAYSGRVVRMTPPGGGDGDW